MTTQARIILLRTIENAGRLGIYSCDAPGKSSKSAQNMLWKLGRMGMLTRNGHRWCISEAGRKALAGYGPPAGPELVAARARIAELEDEILRLRNELASEGVSCPPEWRLTASEERYTLALANVFPRPLTNARALATVWPDTYPDDKIIPVMVCKLRKKLTPHAVEIENIWDRGYRICERGAAAISR